MVRLTVDFEVPDGHRQEVPEALALLCEAFPFWTVLSVYDPDLVPRCPECEGPMTFSQSLQAYVCSHPE